MTELLATKTDSSCGLDQVRQEQLPDADLAGFAHPGPILGRDDLSGRAAGPDAVAAVLHAHPIGRFRAHHAHVDCDQRDHGGRQEGSTPAELRHDIGRDAAGQRRAGQVSATSMEPIAHSPFRENLTSA